VGKTIAEALRLRNKPCEPDKTLQKQSRKARD